MKTATFIAIFFWFICLIGVIEIGCELVSTSDTLLNILGLALMAGFGFISATTNCFTNKSNKL